MTTIHESGDTLNLAEIGLEDDEIERVTRDGLYWKRDGMLGLVPAGTVADVFNLNAAYKAMKQHGRIVEIPAVAYTLYWSMCEDVRCESDQDTLK